MKKRITEFLESQEAEIDHKLALIAKLIRSLPKEHLDEIIAEYEARHGRKIINKGVTGRSATMTW